MAERERYDRRPKRRHKKEKVAFAPILAMKARKPPKGDKSRADEKSALSVRKHGDMRHVSEKRDFITMLVRGKMSQANGFAFGRCFCFAEVSTRDPHP